MSDSLRPRPSPGTDQYLPPIDGLPPLPRYRAELARIVADAARGRLSHSEQERGALVDAYARDLAQATRAGTIGPGPVRVPLLAELYRMSDQELIDEVRPLLEGRAQAVADVRAADLELAAAAQASEVANDELAAVDARKPAEAALGRRWTHPVIPLALLIPFGYLEVKLTAPSIRAALEISDKAAEWTAAAISFVPLLAAEVLGLALGVAVIGRRRAARALLLTIAIATLSTAAWAVADLASSREVNEAYRAGLGENAGAGADKLGQGFGDPEPAAEEPPAEAAERGEQKNPDSPYLGFILPLTLAAMMTATGVTMRCAAAHQHSQWERDRWAARNASRTAADRRGTVEQRQAAAAARLDDSDLRIGAATETEEAITARLIARLETEYQRACLALSIRQLQLLFDLPDPGDRAPIAHRLVDPERATSTQPVVVPTRITHPAAAPPDDQPPEPGSNPQPAAAPTPAPRGDPAAPPEPAPAASPGPLAAPSPTDRWPTAGSGPVAAPEPEPAPGGAPGAPPHPVDTSLGPPPEPAPSAAGAPAAGSWIRLGWPPGWATLTPQSGSNGRVPHDGLQSNADDEETP